MSLAVGCDETDAVLKTAAWSTPRNWVAHEKDGSVHCLGNGRLCVYEQGPEIMQFFGPPYSTTTIGRIRLEQDGLACQSRRVNGTAIWQHLVASNGKPAATMTDFVDSERPCFIRRVQASEPVECVFHPEPGVRIATNDAMLPGAKGGLLIETPIGKPSVPFGNYPIPFAFFQEIAWRGEMAVARDPSGAFRFTFGPGESFLYIGGGPELAACLDNLRAALGEEYAVSLGRTKSWWDAFTAKDRNFAAELPQDVPMRERLLQVLDDVAVLIKAQQAVEGGVLAGYPYHLGYVRDQYGTHRGLIALGHGEMSRGILNFYYEIFAKYGRICNAQALGIPGLFHVHENDDVEITGYITLQAFDYLAHSGDVDFVKRIFPMLEWAWTAQQRHFIKDMLPFNGDETYVAGGILPRTTLNDGSSEATMLFVESGRSLLAFARQESLWDAVRIEKETQVLNRVRDAFRGNFWRENRLITNNPERSRDEQLLPAVRHGVCENCATVQWTMRTDNGRYVCTNCLNKPPLPRVEPKTYTLQSVSLMPLYYHASLFQKEELRAEVEEIVAAYKATGKLPSRPDGEVSVGYDYGLLLYALTELDHPMAGALYEKTLSLADADGGWSEYYRNHEPAGTRCRPWESAINVEAILHWIEKTHGGRN